MIRHRRAHRCTVLRQRCHSSLSVLHVSLLVCGLPVNVSRQTLCVFGINGVDHSQLTSWELQCQSHCLTLLCLW
jgi:hypothetical protein